MFTCWAFKLVYVCSSKILKIHQVHDAKLQHRKATTKMAEKTSTKKNYRLGEVGTNFTSHCILQDFAKSKVRGE